MKVLTVGWCHNIIRWNSKFPLEILKLESHLNQLIFSENTDVLFVNKVIFSTNKNFLRHNMNMEYVSILRDWIFFLGIRMKVNINMQFWWVHIIVRIFQRICYRITFITSLPNWLTSNNEQIKYFKITEFVLHQNALIHINIHFFVYRYWINIIDEYLLHSKSQKLIKETMKIY